MRGDCTDSSLRHDLADQALSRAAGAPLIPGNRIRILKDAEENYPAWLEAMRHAQRYIHFESYIVHEDQIGRQFSDLLIEKARQGIKVRLIYDWLGAFGNASSRFWRQLSRAGVDVRCFNPLRPESPFGWMSRDHRKSIVVDGNVAFVSGLCLGKQWEGYPERNIESWRDTGVQIEGPALVDVEHAFADVWAVTGERLPADEIPALGSMAPAGDVDLRIVASVPSVANIYRLDQLLAALAQKSIWLSDAYFVGTASYVQALRTAALAGVDVRLLVPGANDVWGIRALSRAGLRPLLEVGVRVFEWNGPMMHAKAAVIDGHWSRVGSTNLNLASWIANWELDVVVENRKFANEMEDMYLDDLDRATEIVLSAGHRIRRPRPITEPTQRRLRKATAGQTAANFMRLGHAVGAAITDRRELGPAEAVIMIWAAVMLTAFSLIALKWPRGVITPIVVLCLWVATTLLVRAYKLHAKARHARKHAEQQDSDKRAA
jgi:cardiolipin synthase